MFTLSACGGEQGGATDAGASNGSASREIEHSEERAVKKNMAAEDGWVKLHNMEIPAAGSAVMTIDGTGYDVDIQCEGPGISADEKGALFLINIHGQFALDDGRSGYIHLQRSVGREAESFYPYAGLDSARIQVVVESFKEGQSHSSLQGGPNDLDPKGKSLPLVHAQPDGSFTLDSNVKKMMFHEDALDGPITLAGRCPEAWGS